MLDVPVAQNALDVRRCESSAEDILYGIFTSGSTGKPKCVVVSHRAVIDFITHFIETFGFSSGDKIGNQRLLILMYSVKDIYTSLATGAELVNHPQALCFLRRHFCLIYLLQKSYCADLGCIGTWDACCT